MGGRLLTGDAGRALIRLGTLAGARAAAAALGCLGSIVVARLLGPSALGTWGLALAVQGWALHAGEFGLRSVATSEAARRPTALGPLLRRYLGLRLGITALVVVVVAGAAAVVRPDALPLLILTLLAVPAAALQLDWVPLSRGQEGRAAALLLARPAAFLALIVAVRPAQAPALAAIWLAAWVIAALLSWPGLGRPGGEAAPAARDLLRRGAPLCVVTCLNQAQLSLDLLVVGAVMGTAMAGDYWLASQIAVAGLVMANAANQLALARIAVLPEALVRPAVGRELRLLMGAALALAAAFVAVQPLIPHLFGHAHAGAGRILLWLLPWLVLQHPTALLQGALAARGRGDAVLRATLVGVVVLALALALAAWIAAPAAFACARGLAELARLVVLARSLPRPAEAGPGPGLLSRPAEAGPGPGLSAPRPSFGRGRPRPRAAR